MTVIRKSDRSRVDLTGATIEFQVKASERSADPPLIAKDNSVGVTILDQTDPVTKGQADIELDPEDTSGLEPGPYRYDVVVVLPSGERHVVVPPSDFVLKPVVNFFGTGVPAAPPGSTALQSKAERSFLHTWSADGSIDTVTIPGGPGAMFDASYVVTGAIEDVPAGGSIALLHFPAAGRTQQAFPVIASGTLKARTTIAFIVRDRQ